MSSVPPSYKYGLYASIVIILLLAGTLGWVATSPTVVPTTVVRTLTVTGPGAGTVTVTQLQTVTLTRTVTVTSAPTLPPPEAISIKVGLLFPLTGALADLGTDQFTGAKIAIDMINEQGGVLGRYKVEYVVADSQSDPRVAASEAERLITVDKVSIIIGSYASPILLAASEVAERYKTIYWEVGAITDRATLRNFQYLFRPQPIGGDYGIVSVEFIKDVVAPKIGKPLDQIKLAVIYEDGPYGTSVGAANVKHAQKLGMQVVLSESYSAAATDLSSLILKLKAAEPDVILHTGYFSDVVLFLRQAKELGLKTKAIIGHGAGYGLPALWRAVGQDLNYIFNVDPSPPFGLNLDVLKPELRPLLSQFIERFRQERGYDPLTHAHMGFANTLPLLLEVLPIAIQKYGNVDPESVRKAALEVDLPEGGTTMGYGLKFAPPESPEDTVIGKIGRADSPELHVGQNIRSYPVVMQWRDGLLYVVYPERISVEKAVVPLPPESPYAATG